MTRVGYPLVALLVLLLSTVLLAASAVAQMTDEKRTLLRTIAAENRNAFFTIQDIDAWCGRSLSIPQISNLLESDRFERIAKLRLSENTEGYYDKIYSFECPAVQKEQVPVLSQSKGDE